MNSSTTRLHSTAAIDRVNEEIQIVRDERDSFAEFERSVRQIPSLDLSSRPTVGVRSRVLANCSETDVYDQLERSYRSTVMETDHYDSEYGDTFEESVRTEFNRDAVRVLIGNVPFTPLAKERLLKAASTAQKKRSLFLEDLERELAEVSKAESRIKEFLEELRGIESAIDTPDDCQREQIRKRLSRIQNECDSLASSRQNTMRRQQQTRNRSNEPIDLCRYLYADEVFTTPILADIGVVGGRLEQIRDELSSRVRS